MHERRSFLHSLAISLLAPALLALGLSPAGALTRVDLSDSLEGRAFDLVVDGVLRTLSLAEIEALGLYRVETTTPWENSFAVFEGALLRDVLRHVGLAEEPAIILRAIDGYTQVIPREDWQSWPTLIATRSYGKPLSRRNKGPTRLVYPLLDHPELDTLEHKARWIWLIDALEPNGRRDGKPPR